MAFLAGARVGLWMHGVWYGFLARGGGGAERIPLGFLSSSGEWFGYWCWDPVPFHVFSLDIGIGIITNSKIFIRVVHL